ncbi:MAG TPA: polysaccharide deacetylase family protein [Longimicrobium sp.]|nr:polysaccharide deacetylase family protein [Longimicrobium sp.]
MAAPPLYAGHPPRLRGQLAARLKHAASRVLFASRAHRPLLGRRGAIVAFHRVDDRLAGTPLGCTRADFAAYCDFFRDRFHVIPLGEMVARVRAGRPVGGCLSITFDDGYLDNLRVAAPELRARGLPACFFVATELVGSRVQPAWDREFGARAWWMSWDQVRALHAQGFEIGAHTVSHADLGRTHGAAAIREIAGSRARLQAELGAPVIHFSYPFGARDRITDANRLHVAAAGFDCCLSAFGGTVRPGDDPYRLRRAAITPWHHSPAHLGFELLFREPPPDSPAP